jgi:exocyst complex component 1
MLASIERFMADVDEYQNAFFLRMLEKQHIRMKNRFDRHVQEQIKVIEKTMPTTKKREGVTHFIKFFPVYVQRVEAQLVGINVLEVRENVDAALERIVDAMFDTLQQMARIGGNQEEKEKGQLNYHVMLIGQSAPNEVGNFSICHFREHALFLKGNISDSNRLGVVFLTSG